MTVFNGGMLFNGTDTSGLSGLWLTDGTVAGTHELVAGAGGVSDPSGLNPNGLTVFDGEVLFNGVDASGHFGLWVTNGTAGGTHEVTGITGAYATGVDLGASQFTMAKCFSTAPTRAAISVSGRPTAR